MDISGKEFALLLLFYIIWPFGAWLYSVVYITRTRSAYIIYFLFSLLICWHFSPQNVDHYDDFLGILDRFRSTHISTSDLGNIIKAYFTGSNGSEKELYEAFLNWFSRLFTENYHFYFFLASIPVALCQLKTMKRLTGDARFKNASIYCIILLVLFIIPRDIFTVQNYRFATGFWLCLMGTVNFYCNNENGRRHWPSALFILIAPLCHSALLVYWPIFFVALFVRPYRKYKLLEIAAIISIAFTFFDANLFGNISLPFLPTSIQKWGAGYMSEESYRIFVLNEGRSGFWWVDSIFRFAMKFIYVIMTIQLVKYKKEVYANRESATLYPFYLILFTAVNLIQFVPVLGGRFYWFIQVFCLLVWFKAFGLTKSKMLLYLLAANSYYIIHRYGYFLGGALSVNTNPDLFYTPLPYLIATGFMR